MEVRRASLAGKAMDVPAPKEKGGRMDPIGGAAKPNGVVAGGKLASLRALSGGRRSDELANRGNLSVDGLLASKGVISSGPLPYSGDLASNVGINAGVGGGMGVSGAGGGAGSQGFVELSRRRLANDPAMMRELKRYQELMLQTLLPTISSDGEHHHAPQRLHLAQDSPEAFPGQRGQPDGTDDPDRNLNEHLPRPEPTDAISGVTQHLTPLRHATTHTTKSACSHESQGSRSVPSGPASAGTRLPHAVYHHMDTSPRPSRRRRSSDDQHRRGRRRSHDEGAHRRRSHGDEAREEEVEEEDVESSRLQGANAGELDLLTLAALYLESRHRVFGQELHHAPPNTRPHTQGGTQGIVGTGIAGTGIAGTGIARPRRLSPLSPSDSPPKEEKDKERMIFSAVMPTPAGLHLSVNYTQNLGLEESIYLAERARALRPRLRRLNSLDDLLPSSSGPSSASHLQKATSAPDLSSSGHGRKGNLDLMVGGSLATNSTVDTAKTSTTQGQGQDVLGNLTKKRQLSHLPDSSRAALPPPRLSLRSARVPQESLVRDLPRTPPPTASEGVRRVGRVHLEPLGVRKSSH
ncbi:uncharacterized protein LOC123507893 isoform X2 [Portunus trituberculatus]|uniref:uncharacterized protein LOC123507893 isoform X2 n=1 Tax=Portunus trituberculatus TaxID=210409 RepID=UPI001E1D1FC2|nr:uncharacterized protein LOC123507893 isoform X2 [Portunus trituberculatus]